MNTTVLCILFVLVISTLHSVNGRLGATSQQVLQTIGEPKTKFNLTAAPHPPMFGSTMFLQESSKEKKSYP